MRATVEVVSFALASACMLVAPQLALGQNSLSASADDLTIMTRELGDWSSAIAHIESDATTGDVELHVRVLAPGGRALRCEEYQLQLDDVGRAAFTLGSCDAGTGETLVVLRDRNTLFEPGLPPRPRLVGVSVVRVQTAGARGGAGMQGGSTMYCSVDVHPYLVDEQHGGNVPLVPGRYALRLTTPSAVATPSADGWIVRATEAGELNVSYEIVDQAHGDVVLRRVAHLSCGDSAADGANPSTGTSSDTPPAQEAPEHVELGLRLGTRSFMRPLHLQPGIGAPRLIFEWGMTMRLRVTRAFYLGADFGAAMASTGWQTTAALSVAAVVGVRSSGTFGVFAEAAIGGVSEGQQLIDMPNGDGPQASRWVPLLEARMGLSWTPSANFRLLLMFGDNLYDPSMLTTSVAAAMHF